MSDYSTDGTDSLPDSDSLPEDSSRILLGSWPTPLEPAPRLATILGLGPDDLWIKRDDLGGLGGGGNKVRKLEWTIGAAVAARTDVLVTTGAPQSNHARLTAAAGARLGLGVVLVFPGSPPSSAAPGVSANASGNIALDGLFGARIAWAGDVGAEGLAAAAAGVVEGLRHSGARPALIPFGGSDVMGARGYVLGGQELLGQAPDLRTVVVALGSGGTMAGLVAALGPERALGVDTGARDEPLAFVAGLVGELAAAGSGTGGVAPEQLRARFDLVGSGYADLVESTESALLLAARSEGIVLDPIYTGRALAGLAAAVRDGDIRPGEKTVLLHTGGLPGLFGHAAAIERAYRGLGAYPPAD